MRYASWLLLLAGSVLLLVGCAADDPVASAAEGMCEAIDAEPSDELAFEEYERSMARERRGGLDEDELRDAVEDRCARAVFAITEAAELAEAKADESDARDEPEEGDEEPDDEPVDLREIAWAEQQWRTDCAESGNVTTVSLTPVPEEEGRYWHNPDPDNGPGAGMTYTVEVDSVVYGDVTGDGIDDAVFASQCFLGNDFDFRIEVWSHDEQGEPALLAPVLTYTKWDGVVEDFDAEDDRLRIHTSEPAPDEQQPHLNGYAVEVVTDWHFDGTAWVAEEVSRTDTTPEPEPAPEPAPDTTLTACEQLGFPESDDEEWCAQTIRDMEECQREIDSDPNWVPYDGALYENLVTGEITTCDI
ncbi:hypothetical protein ER308_16630 [Egibacter rhizosphaerae]|uniref:Uncharacterized protein n=1 Tax=Egibacter rhizosphaerae TaxID=1670831 RepID=A0A411YIL4_9ACTN|nr:hypothetical protein [Egibacter rhizosphaerae]QBI21037.1 hypothetical protein ER308_16630 [Egibacter rhizosphaerae]